MTIVASQDASAPLPQVPVWADDIAQAARYCARAGDCRPSSQKVNRKFGAKATSAVREVLTKLEHEMAQGHGKASARSRPMPCVRHSKECGRLIDDKLGSRRPCGAGGSRELEGWQRWRADQLARRVSDQG